MEKLLDKEFTDPNWTPSEEHNIFTICEFTKLDNNQILQLLQCNQIPAERIIQTEFTTAYNYTFKAWFETREFLEKTEPASKTTEVTPDEICKNCDHVDPWKCFISEPKEKFVEICTKKCVSNICTVCKNCKKGKVACPTCGVDKYHHPGERGKIQCRWCDGTGYADYGGNTCCHSCRGKGWMPCKSFKNLQENI